MLHKRLTEALNSFVSEDFINQATEKQKNFLLYKLKNIDDYNNKKMKDGDNDYWDEEIGICIGEIKDVLNTIKNSGRKYIPFKLRPTEDLIKKI